MLHFLLQVKFVLDLGSPLLLSCQGCLLSWVVKQNLHLVDFLHWSLVGCGHVRLEWLLVWVGHESRLRLNLINWVLLNAHGIFTALLTQIDLDARLRVASSV